MTDTALDVLQQDALARRVKGVAGGHRIAWAPRDIAQIAEHVRALPPAVLREASVEHKRAPVTSDEGAIRSKLADAGLVVRAEPQATDTKFLFKISSQDVDLSSDVISVTGWDYTAFTRNPAVLASHDSGSLPIATSSMPWVAGTTLLAIATFPAPGVSAMSDQVAAAVRAKLVKGASVGFVPLKWTFSSDPTRPLGIDFAAVRLLEWSTCAIPCNSACTLIGAVSSDKAAPPAPSKPASRPAQAPKSVSERMAEARRIKLDVDRFMKEAGAEQVRLSRAAFEAWRDR